MTYIKTGFISIALLIAVASGLQRILVDDNAGMLLMNTDYITDTAVADII